MTLLIMTCCGILKYGDYLTAVFLAAIVVHGGPKEHFPVRWAMVTSWPACLGPAVKSSYAAHNDLPGFDAMPNAFR
jgi:hypothetical protein